MREHSDDLARLALLNERVVDDDVLLPRQAKEIRVAVSATLAPVDDVQLVQRELQALRQRLGALLELALVEGGQLVEQRQDGDRIDGDHEYLQTGGEDPEVEEKLVARALDDSEEPGEDRGREDEGEQVGLDEVGDEQLGRLLVEAVFLLEDEGVIQR